MKTGFAVVLLVAACGASQTMAGKKEAGFLNRTFKGDGAKYVVYIPPTFDGRKSFPAIVFLHGSGETGSDGLNQTKVGLGPAIMKRKGFPFIVVFPQSQDRTWKAKSDDGQRALAILDEVMKAYKVDDKRVYLTGLSMGGFGTWSMAAAHPERWAAIAPICGGGDPDKAEKIKDIPCWCFHGDADKAVPVQRSREMIEALKKAGSSPRYNEYPGVGHNSWDLAYGNDKLYAWFLSQKTK